VDFDAQSSAAWTDVTVGAYSVRSAFTGGGGGWRGVSGRGVSGSGLRGEYGFGNGNGNGGQGKGGGGTGEGREGKRGRCVVM
jgi:hypothetical protein